MQNEYGVALFPSEYIVPDVSEPQTPRLNLRQFNILSNGIDAIDWDLTEPRCKQPIHIDVKIADNVGGNLIVADRVSTGGGGEYANHQQHNSPSHVRSPGKHRFEPDVAGFTTLIRHEIVAYFARKRIWIRSSIVSPETGGMGKRTTQCPAGAFTTAVARTPSCIPIAERSFKTLYWNATCASL